MISVLIITLNEEKDLGDCLKSIAWSDDIHVFDSFSSDRTVEIALKAGANVTQRRFDGYSSQRNAAIASCPFRNPWVLFLDADERVPNALTDEMLNAIQKVGPETVGFRIRRKDFLFGQWLKRAQLTPWYIRLVRPRHARYEREINEVLRVDGQVCELNKTLNHFPFSKGISHWIDRHNHYSTREAAKWIEEHRGRASFSWSKAFLSKDFSERRFHQKGLFYKLPARPLIKWFYMVLWRRSFLDGAPGLTYATLQAVYEYFIVLKTRELLANVQPQPDANKSLAHLHNKDGQTGISQLPLN
jgi:glycosyltransferase involved in cell wall biosynthesis